MTSIEHVARPEAAPTTARDAPARRPRDPPAEQRYRAAVALAL